MHGAAERIGTQEPEHQPADGERQTFADDLEPHLSLSRTERHAKPDLSCPLRDRVGHHAVDPDARQQERQCGEPAIERHVQPIGCQLLTDDLIHRSHFHQRQLGIHRLNLRSETLSQCARVGCRTNRDHRLRPRSLCERHVELRRLGIPEPLDSANVAHHPDDMPLDSCTRDTGPGAQSRCPRNQLVHPHSLLHGITAGEKELDETLVDHGHALRVRPIVSGKCAAALETDPKGLEEPRRNHLHSHARPQRGRALGLSDDAELPEEPRAEQRKPGGADAGVDDTGNRPEPLEQLPVEALHLGGRGKPRLVHRQPEREDVIRAHAKVGVRAVPETHDRQAGAGEQGDRQGKLEDDERMAKAPAPASGRAAPRLLQRVVRVHSARLPRLHRTTQHSTEHRGAECEEQDREAQSRIRLRRQRTSRQDPKNTLEDPDARQRAQRATGCGQQQTIGQGLPDQTSACGPKCGADDALALPRCAA